MACKTESTNINGHQVTVTQWPIKTSLTMKVRIATIAGPAFGELVRLDGNLDGDPTEAIADGLSAVFSSTNIKSPHDVVQLLEDIVISGGVNVGGKAMDSATFTELFSGDGMGMLYKFIGFILKVNYGGLMSGLGSNQGQGTEANSMIQADTQT